MLTPISHQGTINFLNIILKLHRTRSGSVQLESLRRLRAAKILFRYATKGKMEIVFDLKPSEKDISFLEQQLINFNCSKIENYSYESFIIKAISEDDSIIAGIHLQVGGEWLYIASLWVNENHRGKGFGKKLLGLAEKAAIDKKCNGVYLYTYSFQNPQFYVKYGYSIFGSLENFCGKHTKYFMKKNLA